VNTLEDRLRDAYRAAAETVGPEAAQHAPAPPRRPCRASRAPRPRWIRASVPLAAAAAVAVIAVLAALIPGGTRRSPGGAAPVVPAAARDALLGTGNRSYPPFILGAAGGSPGDGLSRRELGVYSATNGRLLDSLAPPRKGYQFVATAATGDSRAFIVAARIETGACNTYLYRLQLGAEGQIAGLTPLAVPKVSGSGWGLSASANGNTVAYTSWNCRDGSKSASRVGVINVAAKKVRTWPLGRSFDSDPVTTVSLSGNGKELAFVDAAAGKGGDIRAMDTNAPSGPIERRSRVVLASSKVAADAGIALSPSGSELLACVPYPLSAANYRIAIYGVPGGRLLGMYQVRYHSDFVPCEVSLDPAGRWLLLTNIFPLLHGRPSPAFPKGRSYAAARVDLASGKAALFGDWPGGPPVGVSW
jgi:hypothetical protein